MTELAAVAGLTLLHCPDCDSSLGVDHTVYASISHNPDGSHTAHPTRPTPPPATLDDLHATMLRIERYLHRGDVKTLTARVVQSAHHRKGMR